MKGLTNWQKIGLKYVRYDRRARLDKIFFLEIAAVNLIGTFIWGWRRNDDGWKDEPTGERAPSLSVHKMPRPSYEVDSVSLSTDPKVTESFWDYLNGRIDRLILWPSRKGYCSALYPFFHTAFRPASLLRSAAEKAGLAPPGCFYPRASIRTSFVPSEMST